MFDPIEYINEPRWQKVSLGLTRIKELLNLLGSPQNELEFVHVAGTNGKGSVCAFLESALRMSGLKTGLFTSPYVQVFNDRIRVDNKNINDEELLDITLQVRDAANRVESILGEHPTEFELMTAIAFLYFLKSKCDIVVCEVGLGGRLDSTNVIVPKASVITKIGLDHIQILGNSLEEIANEKAGIIKDGVPVVSAAQEDSAMQVILDVARKKNSKIYVCEEQIAKQYDLMMKGNFQYQNASIAKRTLDVLAKSFPQLNEDVIKKGIESATWPGRFEIFDKNLPDYIEEVIVDGAHNIDGARALKDSLLSLPNLSNKRLIAIFGALKDKDIIGVLSELAPLFEEFFVYEPNSQRAMKSEDIARLVSEFPNVKEIQEVNFAKDAIKRVLEGDFNLDKNKNSQNIVVCFGSLYSIGEIRVFLIDKTRDS